MCAETPPRLPIAVVMIQTISLILHRSLSSLRTSHASVLKQTLEGSGALGQVRAKIRAEIFKALEEVRSPHTAQRSLALSHTSSPNLHTTPRSLTPTRLHR